MLYVGMDVSSKGFVVHPNEVKWISASSGVVQ